MLELQGINLKHLIDIYSKENNMWWITYPGQAGGDVGHTI